MRRTWFVIFVIATLCSSAHLSAASSENNSQKETAEKELKALQSQIKKLQKKLQSTQRKKTQALAKLRQTEKQIATASKILRATERQLKQKNENLKKLKQKQASLSELRDKHRRTLAAQIRAAYINGDEEYLKLLLNQDDPEAFGRMMVYYEHLNQARLKQVKALQQTLAELQRTSRDIEAEIRSLEVLKQAKRDETNRLLALKKERKALVDRLASEVKTRQQKIAELEQNAKELQQLINEVNETIKRIAASQPLSGLSKLKGKLRWPLKGRIVRNYGERLAEGLRSNGVLIAAQEGSEVDAIHAGRVVYADWLRGFGLLVILDHGDGYMSLYGYNQALYKDVGDWVEAGEPIASVGSSGGQQRSGLYFELRRQGKPINPKRWMRR